MTELNPYVVPPDEQETPNRPVRRESAEQAEVNSLLHRGVVFSIIWLMGFGSVYALYLAWRARRIMQTTDLKLRGKWKLAWCVVFGFFGISFWLATIVAVMLNDR